MRCKKILIFTVLLLFLAVYAVPVSASDRPKEEPTFEQPHNNDADGDPGGGEEHPWQDNDDDDGIFSYKKGLKCLLSLFSRQKEVDKKPVEEGRKVEPVKKHDKK